MSAASRLLEPAALNDLLLYRVARLSVTAGAPVVRLCESRFGITRREWRLIAMLADAGTLAPSQLAQAVQLDRARTSRAVSSLLAKGLVERRVRANDQRYAQVALSEAGRALHAALFPLVAEINRGLLRALSADEVALFEALLARLQQRAEQAPLPATSASSRR